MPRGVPRFGQHAPVPQPEVLGTIPADNPVMDITPQGPEAQWEGPSGSVSFSEEPPPWELAGNGDQMADADRFVEGPSDVIFRWINPRLLESEGWRDWRAVTVSDKRFKCKVASMVAPDGNVRRGGDRGDILAFMPRHWVESRRKLFEKKAHDLAQSAVDRQEALKEEIRKLSPYMHIDHVKHPRYTNADGRTMIDP